MFTFEYSMLPPWEVAKANYDLCMTKYNKTIVPEHIIKQKFY